MIQVLLTYKILGVTRAQVLRKFLMVKCISCCKIGTATAQHLNRNVVIRCLVSRSVRGRRRQGGKVS